MGTLFRWISRSLRDRPQRQRPHPRRDRASRWFRLPPRKKSMTRRTRVDQYCAAILRPFSVLLDLPSSLLLYS
ncbi:hypothetical protein BOTBODRAFT_291394 [Botryobasidium botryosum FD-172 SS1]|uniref:Uncharacterized protein n=1 Tax=Botryobasidium botryosum (strain FD-172 SS1) TaxID=930990 RepID=A0A067ML23_BOTB1|nr:hypothetical protein BOTBODRAFT_291394 [Botryobasidium botryosum FD-172 SS1]